MEVRISYEYHILDSFDLIPHVLLVTFSEFSFVSLRGLDVSNPGETMENIANLQVYSMRRCSFTCHCQMFHCKICSALLSILSSILIIVLIISHIVFPEHRMNPH